MRLSKMTPSKSLTQEYVRAATKDEVLLLHFGVLKEFKKFLFGVKLD